MSLDRVDLRTPAGRRRLASELESRLATALFNGFKVGFWLGLLIGSMLGLGFGIGAWTTTGFGFGILTGLAAGIGIGLAIGIAFTFALVLPRAGSRTIRDSVRDTIRDREAQRSCLARHGKLRSRQAGSLFGFGLASALGDGSGTSPALSSLWASQLRLDWAVLRIRFFALASIPSRDSIFAHSGLLPTHPARFLDWACTAGLMRLSGISVQFRHLQLQQYLLRTPPISAGQPEASDNS